MFKLYDFTPWSYKQNQTTLEISLDQGYANLNVKNLSQACTQQWRGSRSNTKCIQLYQKYEQKRTEQSIFENIPTNSSLSLYKDENLDSVAINYGSEILTKTFAHHYILDSSHNTVCFWKRVYLSNTNFSTISNLKFLFVIYMYKQKIDVRGLVIFFVLPSAVITCNWKIYIPGMNRTTTTGQILIIRKACSLELVTFKKKENWETF